MSLSNRWVSFDCFGTLVDWQAWFTEVLGPLGGDERRHAHRPIASSTQRTTDRLRPPMSLTCQAAAGPAWAGVARGKALTGS